MDKLDVVLIAPNAPPRNSAEAIQVRRILAELDKHVRGVLLTVAPQEATMWARRDASLALPLTHFTRRELTLPLHHFTNRVLTSHRLKRLHVPDSMFWIRFMAGRAAGMLERRPDIIYSRSSPMSAALLALKMKQRLHVPWVMHLSDPWSDNPYKEFDTRDATLEAKCFAEADLITLTTHGQAEHYRRKYPDFVNKILVSSNVMADDEKKPESKPFADDRLHVVFAGTLYGDRSPEALLKALDYLQPDLLSKLHIDFYGNAQGEAIRLLKHAPAVVHYHGPVSFAKAYAAQCAADVVLTIEPELDSALSKSFLPSKVVDCLALGKPILAITPEGSETATICNEGYGWAVAPSQPQKIAQCIAGLIEMLSHLRQAPSKIAPERYSAKMVTKELISHMQRLITEHTL